MLSAWPDTHLCDMSWRSMAVTRIKYTTIHLRYFTLRVQTVISQSSTFPRFFVIHLGIMTNSILPMIDIQKGHPKSVLSASLPIGKSPKIQVNISLLLLLALMPQRLILLP